MEDQETKHESLGSLCRKAADLAEHLAETADGTDWKAGPDDLMRGWWVVRDTKPGEGALAYTVTRENAALIAAYGPGMSNVIGQLLRAAGADADMVDAQNARDPENPGKTRAMHSPLVEFAGRVSAALLRES